MRIWLVGLLGLALGIAAARAEEPVPVGDEFQINSYTTGTQKHPDIAVDADGSFVVVWETSRGRGTDPVTWSVQGQRFEATGAAIDGQFQVNSYTTENQGEPAVAADVDGNFVVVWSSLGSNGSDTDASSIQGQRYDAAGTPAGGEFQVNTYTTWYQELPDVAVSPDGDFVVVWEGYSDSDDSGSVQAQRFGADGNPVGDEFQVNTYTTWSQDEPAVAFDSQGNFVVVWTSSGSDDGDDSSFSIQGQRFDATGQFVGGQFQVNTYTTDWQHRPAVAIDSQGGFVVVWQSDVSGGSDTSNDSVQGQRYDAGGTPVGGEFQVNTYTTDYQGNPTVAFDSADNFVVVWESTGSNGTDTSGFSVLGQFFDSSATRLGSEFQVNSYTTDSQRHAVVTTQAGGNLVVVWRSQGSFGSDTNGLSIQGQRFATSLVFTDGFESGDTSAWSSTVP